MDSHNELHDLMGQLGEFGPYQLRQHCLHGIAWLLAAVHMMGFVFVFPVLEHRCYIEPIDSFNASVSDELIGLYIPNSTTGNLESCLKYDNLNHSTTTSCNDQYVYSSKYFTSSRVMDWSMVCDKQWMRALLQSIFLVGTLTGALFSGSLADKFGRKPVFCLSGVLQLIAGVVGVYLENYTAFAVSMFWYGVVGVSGAVVPSVALTMELVGASKRNLCGTMLTVWFGIGAIIVAAWAHFLPMHSKHLEIIYALHSVLTFGHWWLMDESICWLWSNGKREEAIKIVEKAVKFNGKKFINRYSHTDIEIPAGEEKKQSEVDNNNLKDIVESYGILDLFRYPNLRKRTLAMLYCWFASSLMYFGLSFNSVNLFGNPYFMFVINILVEVPGHLVTIFITPLTGNKPLYVVSLLTTGVACIVVVLIPIGTATIITTMMAKVTATISFNIVNSYTAELFPTVIRNTAIGLCVMAARAGASIIPEINLLTAAAEEIPTITFGTVGVLASLFALFLLPETMNRKIPQTIEDIEKSSKENDCSEK